MSGGWMRRVILIFTAFLIIISCSREGKNINIGVIGVLSGRYSEVGVASRNGAELAVDVINMSGGVQGRMLKTTALDDKNDKKAVSEAFEKMISSKISYIIGPNISHLADETKFYAKKDNLLIISPTMSTDELSGIYDNFIRVISVTSAEGTAIAEHAIKMGLKRAAIIYDISNSEYTEPIYQVFRSTFEKDGLRKIVYVNQVSRDTKEDFLSMANNLLATDADMVFLLTTAIDAAHMAQQIRKTDQVVKIFAARWAKTLDIISQGGQAVEGMILSSMYTPTKRSDAYLEFENRYYKKYNTKPSFVSVYAYEAVMVLAEAMKNAKSLDVKDVKTSLFKIGKFKGLEEDIIINKFGDAERKISLARINNGAFEVLDE